MKEADYELVSAKANLRSKLSAQRGRSHNPAQPVTNTFIDDPFRAEHEGRVL
jgi:hypothetical protein